MVASSKIVRPKQMTEVVLDQLRSDIVTGVFELGEKISETSLSSRYGVTKAPIRAAYKVLQAEGLVDVRPQAGTFVFQPSAAAICSLCELRIALELEALRLSLARQPDLLLDKISAVCTNMASALEKHQYKQYQKLDSTFHLVFFETADSPVLQEVYNARVALSFAALRHRFARDQSHMDASFNEHIEMRKLIKKRDIDGLNALLREHIDNTESYYEKLMARG